MKHFYKYKAALFCFSIVCIAGQCPGKKKQTPKKNIGSNPGNNNKQMLKDKFEKIWKNKIENSITEEVRGLLVFLDNQPSTKNILPDQLNSLKEECIALDMPNIQEAKNYFLNLPYEELDSLVAKLEKSKNALEILRQEGPELGKSKINKAVLGFIPDAIDFVKKKYPEILVDTCEKDLNIVQEVFKLLGGA